MYNERLFSMYMWLAIFAITLLAAIAGIIYIIAKIRQLSFVEKIAKDNRLIEIIVSVAIVLLSMVILTIIFTFTNMVIVILHLLVFWLLFDLIAFITKKCLKKPVNNQIIAILVVAFTFLYLVYGWINLRNVQQTNYVIDTDKNIGEGLRVVQITDTHIGTSFHTKEFEEYVEEINKVNPDIVVITGDFVDDSTTYDDFVGCSKALSNFKTKYGVYFVFGNHDKGYSRNELRGYGYEDILRELTKSNVYVLEDENMLIDDRFYICGRQDLSEINRAPMDELVENIDKDKYMLVLDHQPSSYDEEAASNVDLVLSGHTHGGQLIPIIRAGEWMGVNDRTYGYERRNVTDFIVSSGMSDWEIKFKTGCISEYVVIDIE